MECAWTRGCGKAQAAQTHPGTPVKRHLGDSRHRCTAAAHHQGHERLKNGYRPQLFHAAHRSAQRLGRPCSACTAEVWACSAGAVSAALSRQLGRVCAELWTLPCSACIWHVISELTHRHTSPTPYLHSWNACELATSCPQQHASEGPQQSTQLGAAVGEQQSSSPLARRSPSACWSRCALQKHASLSTRS